MSQISLQIQSILYHNEISDLERTLEALAQSLSVYSNNDSQVINPCVVCYGDASREPLFTDKDIQEMNKRFDGLLEIKYSYFNKNTGTATGHNRLGKECTSDYMMIMNPDVIVSPRYFIDMLAPFKDEKVGLVEARQTPIEHPKEYDVSTFETGWAATACVVFPTKVYREVNGFDAQSFFMYCDDVDFSWRIRLAGYKIFYQPLSPVFHAKQLSKDGGWQPTAAERYYSAEAALMMAHKWSRPKLVTRLLWDFKRSNNEELKKAANVYLQRRKNGALVQPIDKEHVIGTFVDGNYAKHRFIL